MSKLLLQVSIRGLHNSMVIPPEELRLKEVRDAGNNIIISDSILRHILPYHLKKVTSQYKVICVCECYISDKACIRNYYQLLSRREIFLKNLRIKVVMHKTEGLVKLPIVYFRYIKFCHAT